MNCIKCLVSGRVQGVFFRASTRDMARSLGLTGHAVNLDDGRVEVFACGEEQALAALKAWLWQGPAHAEVTDVNCGALEKDESIPGRFDVG